MQSNIMTTRKPNEKARERLKIERYGKEDDLEREEEKMAGKIMKESKGRRGEDEIDKRAALHPCAIWSGN